MLIKKFLDAAPAETLFDVREVLDALHLRYRFFPTFFLHRIAVAKTGSTSMGKTFFSVGARNGVRWRNCQMAFDKTSERHPQGRRRQVSWPAGRAQAQPTKDRRNLGIPRLYTRKGTFPTDFE